MEYILQIGKERLKDYNMLEVCWGTAFGHFLLGCHNSMVMALGLCVKWPLLYTLSFVPPPPPFFLTKKILKYF
jgi:hypothetical protein